MWLAEKITEFIASKPSILPKPMACNFEILNKPSFYEESFNKLRKTY